MPDTAVELPAAHGEQAAPPADEFDPTGQAAHVALELAPSTAEKLPATQDTHEALEGAPTADDHVPAPHCEHEDELVSEKAPAPHGVQAALPGVKTVPAGQAAEHADAPAAEKAPRHGEHALDELAPRAEENVPALQGVHEVAEVVAE